MKSVFICLAILFALSITASAQKAAVGVKADPKAAVEAAFNRLVDGIQQVDVDKVMSAYENSPRLLIFNHNGTATQGWDEVKRVNEQIYSRLKNVTLEITGLRVEILGPKAAYVSCKWKQSQESEGKLENASGRMTLIYKLVGKDWKITHRHTSPDRPSATAPVFPSERQP